VTADSFDSGPLDVATLRTLARQAESHPLVDGWAFQPDAVSPRVLELHLDVAQYPTTVDEARFDVRWFETDDYTVHYLETWADGVWQCRWDRHPKPDTPRAHFHPPPDADGVEPSDLDGTHYLDVLFALLDWASDRVGRLHDD
jgi:hypothetical protein